MKEVPAHEILEKFFQTIVEEAKTNPAFAKEMLSAFPNSLITKIDTAQNPNEKQPVPKPELEPVPGERPASPQPETIKKSAFDHKAYNPVVIYRQYGEDLMRVRLNKLSATNLKKIDRAFQLKLSKIHNKKSPTKQDLIKALITFAKNYDTQRKGAAG